MSAGSQYIWSPSMLWTSASLQRLPRQGLPLVPSLGLRWLNMGLTPISLLIWHFQGYNAPFPHPSPASWSYMDHQVQFPPPSAEVDVLGIPVKAIVTCNIFSTITTCRRVNTTSQTSKIVTVTMALHHTTFKVQLQGKAIPSWLITNVLLPICSAPAEKFSLEQFKKLE